MRYLANYDGYYYNTEDYAFFACINNGCSEPYPNQINIVRSFFEKFPHKNRTYIDIGAHIGTTMMPYSKMFKKVVGYEVNPKNYLYLTQNIILNRVKNATVYNLGLFSENCRGDVQMHAGGNSGCYIFVKNDTGSVQCRRLDDECQEKKIEHIDFIKMDTEGCELLILQGGLQTILKNKPLIQIEVNSTAKDYFNLRNEDTIQFLLDLGYVKYDYSDNINIFLYHPDETLSVKEKTIYTFWTGPNEMSENRKRCLEQLRATSGVPVKLITESDLPKYILEQHPLHPAYQYLSYTHRADYLRTYFMHFYGGGYSDIKETTGSWVSSFEALEQTPDAFCCGYAEIPGVASLEELKSESDKLIGNGAYIFRPNTEFTRKWYSEMITFLDSKLAELILHPANQPRDQKEFGAGYPIEWNEMLGRIFHRINYEYHTRCLRTLPISIFTQYL